MTDEPLVWTTKGNVPASRLQYETAWEDTPAYVKLVERYRLDGEIVRESAHVLARHGTAISGEQAAF